MIDKLGIARAVGRSSRPSVGVLGASECALPAMLAVGTDDTALLPERVIDAFAVAYPAAPIVGSSGAGHFPSEDRRRHPRYAAFQKLIRSVSDGGIMSTTIERTVDVERTVEVLAHDAQVRRAQERLLRIEDMRAARQLKRSGMTQREIADVLLTTQPRVGRLLRGASALGDAPSPEEIILHATVRGIPRDRLLKQLRGLDYTFTQFAPYPHEGSVPGTWTQVSTAHQLGLLSDEEYESVSSAVHPPTAQ